MTMQVDQLMGAQVTGSDGQPVGIVDEVFRDDLAGTPSWVRVRSGGQHHLVPLGGSIITTRGLSVPFDARKIADEPTLEVDTHLSAAQEEQLRGYFGIGLPAGPAWTPADWEGHVRSDEAWLDGPRWDGVGSGESLSGESQPDTLQLSETLSGESRWGEVSNEAWLGESRWDEVVSGEARLDESQTSELRLGEAPSSESLPSGSRWDEVGSGESLPGEARRRSEILLSESQPGTLRLSEALLGEPARSEVLLGEPRRSEVLLGDTQPGELRLSEALSSEPRWGEARPGESRWGEGRWGEARPGESQPGEPRLGEPRLGELRLSEARSGEPRPSATRRGGTPAGETRWSGAQPGQAAQAQAQAPNPSLSQPVATSRPGASEPDDQGWLILNEERLEVETEVVESGRVRLHRYVDTESVERVVHLFHEEYEVEHIPIVPGESVSDTAGDGEQELILHEKRAVFVKQIVPVERVRLLPRRVEEDRTFRGEVRRERVEIETEPVRPGTERSGS